MGGTSTDACLIRDLEWPMSSEGQVGALPNRVQQIEINSIGAGGGSIASLGPAGYLRVGPESAGANPGPACYGRGGAAPTVTDANVVLGRLGSEHRLGGEIAIDAPAAHRAVAELGERLGLSAINMADGIVRLAVTQMTSAIKEISVMRGHDPRGFSLFAFGGAGRCTPPSLRPNSGFGEYRTELPGNFSAFGLLAADVRQEHARARRVATATLDLSTFQAEVRSLHADAQADLAAEGISPPTCVSSARLDMRYLGQAFSLPVSVPPDPRIASPGFDAHFAAAYRARYTQATSDPARDCLLSNRRPRPGRKTSFGATPGRDLDDEQRACRRARRLVWGGIPIDADLRPRTAVRRRMWCQDRRCLKSWYRPLSFPLGFAAAATRSATLSWNRSDERGRRPDHARGDYEGLVSIVREMRATVFRTARSVAIWEAKDFSCGLFSASAEVIAQSEDIGGHVVPLPGTSARRIPSSTMTLRPAISSR